MGMVVVAFFAANACGVPDDHDQIDLQDEDQDSVGQLRQRAEAFASANRSSMAILFPSIQPRLVQLLAGRPPIEPRYRKTVLWIQDTRCGRFSLPAARRPQPRTERKADGEGENPNHYILDFRFWIVDCRKDATKTFDPST